MTLQDLGEEWTSTDCFEDDLLVHVVGKKTSTDVPICINKNLLRILLLFTNSEVRNEAGVPLNNPYVFPSTQSENPVCGTAEIHGVCNTLGLKITATKMLHYIASKVSSGIR